MRDEKWERWGGGYRFGLGEEVWQENWKKEKLLVTMAMANVEK